MIRRKGRAPASLASGAASCDFSYRSERGTVSNYKDGADRPSSASTATRRERGAPGTETSLAVLPFDNFSGDPAQEYFVDGVTEALIADLARIRGLRVISRTSSMHYKAQKKPMPEIARELGVDLLVEGSVVRSGNRVRVTAQLIAPAPKIWSRSRLPRPAPGTHRVRSQS